MGVGWAMGFGTLSRIQQGDHTMGMLTKPAPADAGGRTRFAITTRRWDRVGALRRARRIADLSQRDMADRIGVSGSTIARAELASETVTVAVAEAILAQAGLRLVVVDAAGRRVSGLRHDAARNHGGSRYPAHLDAWIATESDSPLGAGWRQDRPIPRLTFHHRQWREARRRRLRLVPRDHSTEADLRLRRHPLWSWVRSRRRRTATLAVRPLEICRCGPRCLEYCVPSCRCQCEPSTKRDNDRWDGW